MASHTDYFSKLKSFDAYPKTLDDFRIKTFGGAAVTILSVLLMLSLFMSELSYYLTKEVVPELYVDTSRNQKLKINLDITFPKIACDYMTLDVIDTTGEQQFDISHSVFKKRLDQFGSEVEAPVEEATIGHANVTTNATELEGAERDVAEYKCGSCYGAETTARPCCDTCEEVREAYRKKGWAFTAPDGIEQCQKENWSEKMSQLATEGCRMYGHIEVNKVAGNFHFAPGKSFQSSHVHVHDMVPYTNVRFNTSHIINQLSFGDVYPEMVNPLDGSTTFTSAHSIMYQYYVKLVPTTYFKLSGEVIATNQFSVTKHQKGAAPTSGGDGLPGVFIMYEFSPIMVRLTEKQRSFMHFLTSVCAIIGGIFTVAGLLDAFIYRSSKVIQKKMELGKLS